MNMITERSCHTALLLDRTIQVVAGGGMDDGRCRLSSVESVDALLECVPVVVTILFQLNTEMGRE